MTSKGWDSNHSGLSMQTSVTTKSQNSLLFLSRCQTEEKMKAVHTSFTLIFLPLLEQILHIFAHLPPIQQPLYDHLVASVEGEFLALKTER